MRKIFLAVGLLLLAFLCSSCGGPTIAPINSFSKVVAFGDSLTAGFGAKEAESYPAILSDLLGVKVYNYGISGEDTAAGLERLGLMLEDEKPTLVLLCFGGNDMLHGQARSATKANLEQMISRILETGSDVVLIGVPQPGIALAVPDFYEELAETYELPIEVDSLRSILMKPRLKSDRIHPNAAGYRVFAEDLFALIENSAG